MQKPTSKDLLRIDLAWTLLIDIALPLLCYLSPAVGIL